MDPFHDPNAVQMMVTLDGIEPLVWRRIVVPWSWHLGQLHLVIQAAFNWWNYHLHEFRIGGVGYGDPETTDWGDEMTARTFDETDLRLLDFAREPGATFEYLYDFGDQWDHVIRVEELLSLDVMPRTAACVDGANARPPEDVGGPGGYENFLSVMSDPDDPEYRDMKRWCGGQFDPAWFDLTIVDKDVRKALTPNVRRRLHQPRSQRASSTE